ncbi:MAG: hypothetical protein LBU42_00670 [Prevotellaceae bacterium]|jgi:hypothetical protein|nr:hypothetical protein [Prevotellaceae bacterium]
MKKSFFLFAMLASVAASAQSHINIQMLGATYTALPTVKFSVSWSSVPVVDGQSHHAKIWVWIDFLKVNVDNTTSGNTWTRALISGTPTATSGTPTRETGNDKGFWLNGVTGSYSETVTVSLSNIPANTKFNWCAYASDCPPNATSYSGGTYTLKGTPPFTVTGNGTIQNGNQYVGTCINSLTDATSCPGGIGRDVVHNACPCAPGLTAVGSYCRDLVADEATVLSCAAVTDGVLEIKLNDAGLTKTWNPNSLCPSGWRWPTIAELKCMQPVHNQLNLKYPPLNYGYWSSESGCTGVDVQCANNNCAKTWKFVANTCGCLASTCLGNKSYSIPQKETLDLGVRCVR